MKFVFFGNTAKNLMNFRKNLILNFLDKHHEVFLIFQKEINAEKNSNFFLNKGCKIYEIYIDRHSLNPIKELITFFQIFKIYNKIKPDITFHFTIKPNIYGSIIGNLRNACCVNNVTGMGYFFFTQGIYKFILFLLYKISIKQSYHTFFHNSDDAKYFLENKLILKDNYSIVPGSGVDTKYYKFCKYPKNTEIKFLFIGRLIKEKGVYEFLQAAEELKKNKFNCEFYILGNIDGRNKSNVPIQMIKNLHDKKIIQYLGEKNDIRPIINKIDVVVLPSYREGISRSLLETCSMGRPIISTNIPGNDQILIENYNGFLCEPKSVSSLISAMKKFLNLNYEKKLALGINARSLIEKKFNEKVVIKKYNEIIENMIL